MICQHCNTFNSDDTMYCRVCGHKLPYSINQIKVNYLPTNHLNWKSPIFANIIYGTALVAVILSVIMLVNIFIRAPWDDHREYTFYTIWGILLVISMLCASKFNLPQPNSSKYLLKDVADYIEPYSYGGMRHNPKKPLYVIFIKDNKMGLLDVSTFSIKIEADFDVLTWHTKNEYLNAINANGSCCMDVNGIVLK